MAKIAHTQKKATLATVKSVEEELKEVKSQLGEERYCCSLHIAAATSEAKVSALYSFKLCPALSHLVECLV